MISRTQNMLTRFKFKLLLTSSSQLTNHLLLIPDEVLAHIFSFLSQSDIGTLCMTGSTDLTDRVRASINTTSFCNRIIVSLANNIAEREGYHQWLELCRQFGLLCKRATMLCSTHVRLRLLYDWYSRLEHSVFDSMDQDWAKLCCMAGLGAATNCFCLGWEGTEFCKVLEWLRELYPGLENSEERLSRNILRNFCWKFLNSDERKGCWLLYTIKALHSSSSSLSEQKQAANLLYLMLGPAVYDQDLNPPHLNQFQQYLYILLQGQPDWNVVRAWTPSPNIQTWKRFSELGKGLRLLLKAGVSRSFMSLVMSSLFEDLQWNLDSQAALFIFTSGAVIKASYQN